MTLVQFLLMVSLMSVPVTGMWWINAYNKRQFIKPVIGCRSEKVDLLLVADAKDSYVNQMKFFSKLIDIFAPPPEENLTRLRVSLVAFSNNSTNLTIPFVDYENKTAVKSAMLRTGLTSADFRPVTLGTLLRNILNGITNAVRPDAKRVIVMAVTHDLSGSVVISDDDVPFLESQNASLTIIFEETVHVEPLISVANQTGYTVKHVSDPGLVIHISVHLCRKCQEGWHGKEVTNALSSTYTMSCYKLLNNTDLLNWMDAGDRCKGQASQLVSIETIGELDFLREYVANQLTEVVNASIFIGLKREESTVGERFRWMNDMPLVYTIWKDAQPNNGRIVACAVWDFPFPMNSYLRQLETQNSSLSENLADSWASVGCGLAKTPYYMCEAVFRVYTDGSITKGMWSVTAASNKSISAATQRGELVKVDVVLMSVTDFLQHSDGVSPFLFALSNHISNQTIALDQVPLYTCAHLPMGPQRIPYSLVCDFKGDCMASRDESNCMRCEDGQPQCDSGQCLTSSAICDLHPDCPDGSDERDCKSCSHDRCPSGRCMPKHWFADGEIDCNAFEVHESLELERSYVRAANVCQCVFTCNRGMCVYMDMLNDGVTDCTGPEGPIDETIGRLESTTCYTASDSAGVHYINWAPKCVYIKDFYKEVLGCRDLSHLQKCENFTCPEGYLKCPDSYCIPTHYVNNTEFDCPSGEDEDQDFLMKCPGYFICKSWKTCLHPDRVCDGHEDCLDGGDERNCNINCMKGFACIAGTMIVGDYNISLPVTQLTVDPEIRYIDLSHVNLSAAFPRFLLSRLTLVHAKFSDCHISNINTNGRICVDTPLLAVLDLSYNDITEVTKNNIFRCMNNLHTLDLSHNRLLSFIDPIALNPLYPDPNQLSSYLSIRELDISYTDISVFILDSHFDDTRLNMKNTPIEKFSLPFKSKLETLDVRSTELEHFLTPTMFHNVTIGYNLSTDSFKLCCPQLHNPLTNVEVCHFTEDPFSSCSDLMSKNSLRILLWVDGVLAISGNIGVIIYRLFCDRKIFQMAYGHFVMHLSFSDLCMGIYLLIVACYDNAFKGTYIWEESSWRRSIGCKIAGFLSTLSNEVSTIFIFLITLDRYLVIRFPFGQFKIAGKGIALCCAIAWVVGFFLAVAPLLPISEFWEVYNTNGMCLALPLTNRRYTGWQFSLAVFIFLNFIMFLFIAFGQVAIYRTISSMRMSEASLTNVRSRRAQDMTVAKNLSLVVITNFLCWCPIGIMGLMALGGQDLGKDAFAWMAVIVLPINSAINPVLYTIPAVWQRFKVLKESMSFSHSKKQ